MKINEDVVIKILSACQFFTDQENPLDPTTATATKRKESYETFAQAYQLTLDLYGVKQSEAPYSKGVKKCWNDIVSIWDTYHQTGGATNIFYHALYHIQWRKPRSKRYSKKMSELLNLIIELLLKDSYAFDAWRTTSQFRDAFDKVLAPVQSTYAGPMRCKSDKFRGYIYSRTFSKVIYKDNPPSISEYMIYVTKHQMSTFYKSHELMCRYLLFEKSIKRLLPESSTWTSEWSDETYILRRVEETLNLDYHNAYGDFDKLIEMLSKMETRQSAVSEFLSVHNFSMELARAICSHLMTSLSRPAYPMLRRSHLSKLWPTSALQTATT